MLVAFTSITEIFILLIYLMFSPVVDLTDKLLYHCTRCLRNISSVACRLLDNGTISCIKCKEHVRDDLLCGKLCPASLDHSNLTGLQESCNTCLCNGTIDTSQLKSCNDVDDGSCFVCQSNRTVLQCKYCVKSDHGASGSSIYSKCVTVVGDRVETKKKSGWFLHRFNVTGLPWCLLVQHVAHCNF